VETGATHVGLDMRHVDPTLFPNVVGALRESGLDPATELVPVAPAAHYMMGGVVTDLHGRSTVPGLYAVGESACTGLHGANRLASNSLSECFVFGGRAGRAALDEPPPNATGAPPVARPVPPPSAAVRSAMWEHAGLERTLEGLESLRGCDYPLARLVAACAILRQESRGSHFRSDSPSLDHALDGHHAVVDGSGAVAYRRWT
jgi:L-aspartate oxidase